MKDEWQLEMDRMLDLFEHESESSLRKINRRFEVLGRPFNDEFRQYFMKRSMQRLDTSFTKIEMERWDNSQVKNFEEGGRKIIPGCSTSASSSGATLAVTANKKLSEDTGIHFNVKSENVIEITDSDDESGGIQFVRPSRKSLEKNVGDGINEVGETISIGSHNMQTQFKLAENGTPLEQCDSNRGKGRLSMKGGSKSVEGSNDLVAGKAAPIKDEINAANKIEFMDEVENIPIVTFDPNLENHQSSTENDGTKQQSKSSTIDVNHTKRIGGKHRFKCEHCDSSFQFKSDLKKHQRVHANGKLIGVKADSNGLYYCTHCTRKFTNIGHLSKHMKVHVDNQYLYDCVRCMRRFDQEVDKDRHESQCNGHHFECHLCKVFVTANMAHLKIHMRKHSGAKPFRCLMCSKSFRHKINLRGHLNTVHSRINP